MEFEISVKTGDRLGSGTDANVFVILHGDGASSDEIQLDASFCNDFERGQTDVYCIYNQKFETVTSLELWKDDCGMFTDWNIDTITVKNVSTAWQTVFPLFRWIKSDHRYKFSPYDTSLPQDDKNKEQRAMELKEKRKLYQYAKKDDGLPVQIKAVPADEKFSFGYNWDVGSRAITVKASSKIRDLCATSWKTIEDLKSIFIKGDCVFPEPSDLSRWKDDVKFGMQRFAGTNNTVIRLCTAIPGKLAVTPKMLKPFLESDTLESALRSKRLFIVDHEILLGCKPMPGTVICSPIALFYKRDDDTIVPIAIQLFQDKADDNPVFLPSDHKYTWILAKMWFNNADACVHQSITHLGYTHVIMEGFVIAAHRNLSQSHPVFKLLAPHFLYLIAINNLAVGTLIIPGGILDSFISVGSKGVLELVKRYRPKWRLNVEGSLPEDLKARGVYDHAVVPDYPFRDDALLTYNAIHKYVTSYVKLYYPSDEILKADIEIQNWRAEIGKSIEEGGLGIAGVPGEGKFTSRDQLIQVVTSIIYTCSVGHAAANFKQYDEYAFPLNYPSLLMGKPPSDKNLRFESDIMEVVLNRSRTYDVMSVVKILSETSTRSLGDFEVDYIQDPKAVEVVKTFRAELKLVSETIAKRNEARAVPFDYLDPVKVPNSISI